MNITEAMLEKMSETDIRTVDISTLTDLRDIVIDTKESVRNKMESFAEQTNNLYINRVGDYAVKVSYQESGASIDDKIEEYIRRLSEI